MSLFRYLVGLMMISPLTPPPTFPGGRGAEKTPLPVACGRVVTLPLPPFFARNRDELLKKLPSSVIETSAVRVFRKVTV